VGLLDAQVAARHLLLERVSISDVAASESQRTARARVDLPGDRYRLNLVGQRHLEDAAEVQTKVAVPPQVIDWILQDRPSKNTRSALYWPDPSAKPLVQASYLGGGAN